MAPKRSGPRLAKPQSPTRIGKLQRRIREPQWVEFGNVLRGILEGKGITVDAFLVMLAGDQDASGRPKEFSRTMLSKILSGYIPPPERCITGTRHLATAKGDKRGKKRTDEETRVPPMMIRASGLAWADVLGLRGQERERFEEAAWVARSPEPVLAIVKRLRARIPADG